MSAGRSSQTGAGVVVYQIGPAGRLRGRWTSPPAGGKVGVEFAAGGPPGSLAGQYRVRILSDRGVCLFEGRLTIAAQGEAFTLDWAGEVLVPARRPAAYHGVGLMAGARRLAATWQEQTDRAAPAPASPAGTAPSIRQLLQVPEASRGLPWLRQMLQRAVQLEFSTIPPYLTAMWSIKDPGNRVRNYVARIVKTEMLHMGLACNLLAAVGGTPLIDRGEVVPSYPGPLPGGVHPGLVVRLQRMSKCLVEHVFMRIEEPEHGPVTYRGESYPTIGAFYAAILAEFERANPPQYAQDHQLFYDRDPVRLTKVASLGDARRAVLLIKEQGEGTTSSPFFGPSPADVAHYYRFGEIFCEHRIQQDCFGHWSYTGAGLPFPKETEIHPTATVPPGGYPGVADEFDRAYTGMLHDLQHAWERGGDVGQKLLDAAITTMVGPLGRLADALMRKPLPDDPTQTYGPDFRLLPS